MLFSDPHGMASFKIYLALYEDKLSSSVYHINQDNCTRQILVPKGIETVPQVDALLHVSLMQRNNTVLSKSYANEFL